MSQTKTPNLMKRPAGFGGSATPKSPAEHIAKQFNQVHPMNGLRDVAEIDRYHDVLSRTPYGSENV